MPTDPTAARCTGDDSCKVPEHWPDPASSGPHRGTAAAGWFSCCDHCGCCDACGKPRAGHDDTCPLGCNDAEIDDLLEHVDA